LSYPIVVILTAVSWLVYKAAVLAPTSGIVIGRTNLPLIHEGDALCHIARFKQLGSAVDTMEAFQQAFDIDQDIGDEVTDDLPIV